MQKSSPKRGSQRPKLKKITSSNDKMKRRAPFKPPKHLQAHLLTKGSSLENPRPPAIDFNELLSQHGGSYVDARRAVQQAARAQRAQFTQEREEKHLRSQDERLFKETVALSFTVGRPTLVNPAQKAQNLLYRRDRTLQSLRDQSNFSTGESSIVRKGFEKEMTDRLRRSLVRGELVITHQSMSTLPQALGDTIALQISPLSKLNLAGNKLKTLLDHRIKGISCFHLRNVVELDLGQNELADLPNDFGVLLKLRHLNLERNKLSMLPGTFYQLAELEWLRLNNNNFNDLPEEFSRLRGLTHLDLSGNMFCGLPPGFAALKHLKFLDLSNNGLLHLAVLRPIRDEDTGRFVAIRDPLSGKKMYFDFRTGESRTELTRVKEDGRSVATKASTYNNSSFGGIHTLGARTSDVSFENSVKTDHTPTYYQERRKLAEEGKYEWEVLQDPAAQTVYYLNNITGESQWEMPKTLDIFGNLMSLEVLKMNVNLLRDLPESFSKLTKMKHMEAVKNHIHELPKGMGSMTKLKIIKFNFNELAQLPSSMCACTALEELHLTSNQFNVFPDFIGQLTRLRLLMLGGNALIRIPPSVGFLTQLKELQLFNNPLIEPPQAVLVEGLEKILWTLRQRQLEIEKGPVPPVGMHGSGIEKERLELEPEFRKKLQDRMVLAKESHELSLHMQGLKVIPPAVYKIEGLQKLSIDYNLVELDRLVFPEADLTSLTDLSMKSCKVPEFPLSLCRLKTLESLRLEDNKIETIPDNIERLWRLKHLNLAINVIHTLPEKFCKLSTLTSLDLDTNQLEVLPDSIGLMRSLKTLSLTRNLLIELPNTVTDMVSLTSLNVDGNLLNFLPEGLGSLGLKVLKASHNRLEFLPDDFLLPTLATTLESFWISNNNLLDLPASIIELQNLSDLHLDYNPMRSPPADLIPEGMQAVIQYCQIRFGRLNEFISILDDSELEYDEDNLTPESRDVLDGDTGYLLMDDLKAFDDMVDKFLNGKYYLYPLPAEKIVEDLIELKAQRQYAFFKLIFDELLNVLDDLSEDYEDFSTNILCRKIMRPWGRNGEQVPCYGLALQYLLRETKPNELYPDFRPAVYDIVRNQLPDSIFPYSKETLKKAIDIFEDPYGKVANVEKYKFPACECIDPDTNKWANHQRCRPKTLIMRKLIYSEEEAKRREEEDNEHLAAFVRVERKVRSYLMTRAGKRVSKVEAKGRKSRLSDEITNSKGQIEVYRAQVNEAQQEFTEATQRKTDYEAGKPFPFHRLHDPDEALELVLEAQEKVEKCEKTLKEREDHLISLKKRKRMTREEVILEAHNDLVQKYCHEVYLTIIEKNRRSALLAHQRRPWDGEDGIKFIQWSEDFDPEYDSFAPEYWWEMSANDPLKRQFLETKKFTWEGCERMTQFDMSIYHTYLDKKGQEGGLEDLISEEKSEFEEEDDNTSAPEIEAQPADNSSGIS